MRRAIYLLALVVFGVSSTACTLNQINFEKDSIRPFEKAKFEPGQGGADSGGAEADVAGGTDRSPAGSNTLRGYGQFGVVIVQGGETTPTTAVNPAANLNSPNSTANGGGGAGVSDGEKGGSGGTGSTPTLEPGG